MLGILDMVGEAGMVGKSEFSTVPAQFCRPVHGMRQRKVAALCRSLGCYFAPRMPHAEPIAESIIGGVYDSIFHPELPPKMGRYDFPGTAWRVPRQETDAYGHRAPVERLLRMSSVEWD